MDVLLMNHKNLLRKIQNLVSASPYLLCESALCERLREGVRCLSTPQECTLMSPNKSQQVCVGLAYEAALFPLCELTPSDRLR